ncbi:MAG: hypothetical protein M3120_08410 [Pseudomonadota bacterium]|nr:hypothetical protein [Pseudomonadota bacterium]
MREKLLWLIREGSVFPAFFIGIVYAIIILVNFNSDTTGIIDASMAIFRCTGSLCFGMSATVDLESGTSDYINYGGERFFRAALFFLLATVVKYAALCISAVNYFGQHEVARILATAHFIFLPCLCLCMRFMTPTLVSESSTQFFGHVFTTFKTGTGSSDVPSLSLQLTGRECPLFLP